MPLLKSPNCPCRPCLPVNGPLVLLQASAILHLVLELLVLDVVLDGLLVEAYGAHVIPLGPETPGPVVVFQVRVLVEDHEARLAFQMPHEARDGGLFS